jgi:phage-related protein
VEDWRGDTFRCVYSVKFAGAVYVLHTFQKKARRGIKTPQHEIDLVKERLKCAQEHYQRWRQQQKEKAS